MLTMQRVLFGDNGTVTDKSFSLNDYLSDTETFAIVAAEDYIYIGAEHPFNYRWIEMSTVNDQASVISVDVWSNSAWNAAVDVQDDTSSGGVALARSGMLNWHINRTKGWSKEGESSNVTGLSGTAIYDMYWVRIKFSADLKSSTAFKYFGFRFASDTDLGSLYPDLNLAGTKTAYESGKTDWNDQHFAAAEAIIKKLLKHDILWTPSQLMDWRIFNEAAIHRVAEIIMNAFGDDYEDNRTRARKYFNEAFDIRQYRVDKTKDGNLDQGEKQRVVRIIRR